MSIFDLFRKKGSASIAKERLMMVLSYERKGLPSNFTDQLQRDLVLLFNQYPQLSTSSIVIDIKSEGNRDQLFISIPFSDSRGG
ncbi:MAG: cell division topological specificity factor MinE [Candidatus Dadabacteria bacterium]|nr:cell division topological specificity factor MinE [Candidatus Dadabacteria bacterium]